MLSKLLELLKTGKNEFCFQTDDLNIVSPINDIIDYGDYVEIHFLGGYLKLYKQGSKVIEIVRPANLIVDCKWCYMVENTKGKLIGYIFQR